MTNAIARFAYSDEEHVQQAIQDGHVECNEEHDRLHEEQLKWSK